MGDGSYSGAGPLGSGGADAHATSATQSKTNLMNAENATSGLASAHRPTHPWRMPETHKLKLISFDLCPYVERSRIVLEEKKIPYDIELIDLKNKPAWFLEISPRGKVPVLVVDGTPIFESMVINEMLEELYPEPPMFPKAPVDRAQARAWIVFCNDVMMMASFNLVMGKTEEERAAARAALDAAFPRLEAQVQKSQGKYFFSDSFSLVDAVFAPFFVRFHATAEVLGNISLEKFPATRQYSAALRAHPNAIKARAENLIERHKTMLKERMSGSSGY
jgi:glutathione S-transferase